MPLLFGHFVVAVLLPASVHVRVREPGIWVYVEGRDRVGNRLGGYIGGLAVWRRLGVCRRRWIRHGFGFAWGCWHGLHALITFPVACESPEVRPAALGSFWDNSS